MLNCSRYWTDGRAAGIRAKRRSAKTCFEPIKHARSKTLAGRILTTEKADIIKKNLGQMAERLNAHAWKACLRASVTGVRIPLCPPLIQNSPLWRVLY